MSKRSFPFEEDALKRQLKHRVSEGDVIAGSEARLREVYDRTRTLLFEGARRAELLAAEAGPSTSHENVGSANEGDMEVEVDWNPYSIVHARQKEVERLKKMEKRDPSPVPNQRLLTSFINSTKRTHAAMTEGEIDTLTPQSKNLRQLNMDAFVRQEDTENRDRNQNVKKDENVQIKEDDPNVNSDSNMEF